MNHFIELNRCASNGHQYLVIHTGSRNLGKQVADYYQTLAVKMLSGWDLIAEEQKRIIEQYKAEGRKTEIQEAIKELHRNYRQKNPELPKDLCYLQGQDMEDYLHDVEICREFANLNRITVRDEILMFGFPGVSVLSEFTTLHNYIGEDGIIRKGAVSAKEGEKLIIPMNMRDGSLLCTGLGNMDWNNSAPHGAGRLMSRTKAREILKLQDYQKEMEGIDTWSVSQETIDEAPQAYKPMEEILELIKPTVEVNDIIKPEYNFKASD